MNKIFYIFATLIFTFYAFPVIAAEKVPIMLPRAIVKINAYSLDNELKIQPNAQTFITSNDPVQTGTGFFIDYQGCAMTAAHVLLREPLVIELFDSYTITLASDVSRSPDLIYSANVVYLDALRDVGIICVQNSGDKFFHPVDFSSMSQLDAIAFGDDVYTMGYPLMGGDTISYTKGYVMGFWERPDLQKFLQVNFSNDLSLIKISGATGPGGSGSPLFNSDNKVLGIVFAGSINPSGAMFAIDTRSIGTSINEKLQEMYANGEIPSDCVYDPVGFLYRQAGRAFYDQQCAVAQDKNIEELVQLNYQARCSADLPEKRLKDAAYTIKATDATLDGWWKYLTELCPIIIIEK